MGAKPGRQRSEATPDPGDLSSLVQRRKKYPGSSVARRPRVNGAESEALAEHSVPEGAALQRCAASSGTPLVALSG